MWQSADDPCKHCDHTRDCHRAYKYECEAYLEEDVLPGGAQGAPLNCQCLRFEERPNGER